MYACSMRCRRYRRCAHATGVAAGTVRGRGACPLRPPDPPGPPPCPHAIGGHRSECRLFYALGCPLIDTPVRSANFSLSVEARCRGAVATYHTRPAAPTAAWMVSASTWGAATAALTSAPLRSARLSADMHLKLWTSLTSCGELRPPQALFLHDMMPCESV